MHLFRSCFTINVQCSSNLINLCIVSYYPDKNVSFIADSNGKFEKLWQFSAYLKSKGCDIIAASKEENMIDEKTPPAEINDKQFIIRSCAMGTPTFSSLVIDGRTYKSLRIGNMEYVPDINEIIG